MQYLLLGKHWIRSIPVHIIVAGCAWTSRGITAISQLIIIRMLTDFLNEDMYAVFVLLTGLMGWYMLADMGVGFSLQNYISELRAKQKNYNSYIAMSSICFLIILVVLMTLLLCVSSYIAPCFLKQFAFLNSTEQIILFFTIGAIYIVTSIGFTSYKIWYAEQQGYIAHIVIALSPIISCIGIYIVKNYVMENRLFWSLLMFTLPSAILSICCLLTQLAKIPCKDWSINYSVLMDLLIRAGGFCGVTVMSVVSVQIDYLILSQYVVSDDIVIYGISGKIFTLVYVIYTSLLASIWPVLTEKIATNDWQPVRMYIKKYLIMGILFIIISTMILSITMPNIVKLISPKYDLNIPTSFIIILGCYQLVRVWSETFSIVLQSMSKFKPLWIWCPIQAIVGIVLQITLTSMYGIYGVVFGLIGSFLLTVAWALPYKVHQLFVMERMLSEKQVINEGIRHG